MLLWGCGNGLFLSFVALKCFPVDLTSLLSGWNRVGKLILNARKGFDASTIIQ